jgi:hypothetical protein
VIDQYFQHLVDIELKASQTRTTCYFFFRDDNEQQRMASNALCALLHQLFSQKPQLLIHAIDHVKNNGDDLKKNIHLLWRILIAASADPSAGEIVCISDALDECTAVQRDILLQMLCSFTVMDPVMGLTRP